MNIFKRWYNQTVVFLKEVYREFKFVTWPTKDEVVDSTKIVFVTVGVLALYLAVLDFLFTNLFRFIIEKI